LNFFSFLADKGIPSLLRKLGREVSWLIHGL